MDRYLKHIRADADRLATAARGHLTDQVPSCPGWSVDDLVEHVGVVYLHKVECTRQQRQPEPWPPPPEDGDRLQWFEAATKQMLSLFADSGPDAPSYTWHEPDQTVGFWYRRMAQETAVHRVDAELAVGPAGPVDEDLALDGVDELLDVFFAGDWSDIPQPDLVARVGLRAASRSWLLVLDPAEVRIEAANGDGADAMVSGSPSDLLLWLWGRLPTDRVHIDGDVAAVDRLLRRLTFVTD